VTLQEATNLVFGGDIYTFGGVTAAEMTQPFTPEEIQQADNYLQDYGPALEILGGLPFPGDNHAYDALAHPGKAVFERMVARWD
jgi:hypothetical protein